MASPLRKMRMSSVRRGDAMHRPARLLFALLTLGRCGIDLLRFHCSRRLLPNTWQPAEGDGLCVFLVAGEIFGEKAFFDYGAVDQIDDDGQRHEYCKPGAEGDAFEEESYGRERIAGMANVFVRS